MMNKKTMYLIAVSLLAGMVSNSPAVAAGSPQLVLQMDQGLQAGAVRDGTRLGRGTLISYDSHTGFQLRSEQALSSSEPGRYVLTGNQHPSHKLRVRLVPQKLTVTPAPDTTEIRLNTADTRVVFDILTDGDQNIAADSYRLNITSRSFTPQ